MGNNARSIKISKKKHHSIIFKDPRLKSQIIHLFFPFLLLELVVMLTTLMSNLVLKWWGCYDVVTAGITNAFQIFFLYYSIACAICFVTNLFMSQHYGRGAIDDVQRDYYALLKIAIGLGIIFFVLALAIPDYLFFFVDTSTKEGIEIKRCAVEYLRWFSPVFLLIGPSVINYTLMKNMHLAKYSSLIAIITFVSVLLIEAASVLPLKEVYESWALEAAACSMIIARVIEFILLFVFINKKCLVKFKFKEFFKLDSTRFKSIIYYGAPILIGKTSWGIGFVMITIISNQIGNVNLLTAHSLMITYQNIVTCLSNSMASVVAVLIGRELGANRLRKAEDHAKEISRLLLLMGVIEMAALILFLPIAYFTMPNKTDAMFNYLWKVFLIQMVMYLPRSYNASYLNGLFSAGGDTIYIMLTDGITAWATIVPLGYIGLHYNWDPLLIYGLIQLEEVIKWPINFWRYKQKKWVNNITHKKGIVFNE